MTCTRQHSLAPYPLPPYAWALSFLLLLLPLQAVPVQHRVHLFHNLECYQLVMAVSLSMAAAAPKLVSFSKPGGFFLEKLLSIPSGGGRAVAAGTSRGVGIPLPPDACFSMLKIGWLYKACHTNSHGKHMMDDRQNQNNNLVKTKLCPDNPKLTTTLHLQPITEVLKST